MQSRILGGDRKIWLCDSFGCVSLGEENGRFKVIIDRVYTLQFMGHNQFAIPRPVFAVGSTPEDTYSSLFDLLIEKMPARQCLIWLFKPKADHGVQPLLSDKMRDVVYEFDPRHDHGSDALADFSLCEVDAENYRVFDRGMEKHCHLLIE